MLGMNCGEFFGGHINIVPPVFPDLCGPDFVQSFKTIFDIKSDGDTSFDKMYRKLNPELKFVCIWASLYIRTDSAYRDVKSKMDEQINFARLRLEPLRNSFETGNISQRVYGYPKFPLIANQMKCILNDAGMIKFEIYKDTVDFPIPVLASPDRCFKYNCFVLPMVYLLNIAFEKYFRERKEVILKSKMGFSEKSTAIKTLREVMSSVCVHKQSQYAGIDLTCLSFYRAALDMDEE